MVHPEVRNTIPHQQVGPPIDGTNIVQDRTGDEKTQVTQSNELSILGLVQRTRRGEVVDTAKDTVLLALSTALGLVLMVVVTRDVGEEVHGPPEQLLQDDGEGRGNWGFLHQFIELVDRLANARSELIPGLGDENHVTSNVTGGLVVLSVRDLPREVRDEQGRMTDPANSIVQPLGRREGLVTTLVSQHPDTRPEHTLDNGVQPPEDYPKGRGGHIFGSHEVVEDIENGRQGGQIPSHIGQTPSGGTLKAVGRNGIPDLLDGVVGELELVAIGVDHLSAVLLLCIRGHGGQRGGRGGLTGTVEGRGRGRDGAGDGGLGGRVAMKRHALGEGRGRHDVGC